MDKKALKVLKHRAVDIKPTLHVGKDGLTEAVADELVRQLKSSGLVKARVLPAAGLDTKEMSQQLADMSSSVLVDVRGNTAIFCDKRTFLQAGQRSG